MPVTLEYLADHPKFVPIVAAWYYNEWGKNHGKTLEHEISQVNRSLSRTKIPLTMIAVDDNEVIGAGQLKWKEMSIYPDKPYWLGGIYVASGHRGKQVAQRIVAVLFEKARVLNIDKLYLQTEKLDGGLYASMGWTAIEQIEYQDNQVLVMERSI